MKALFVLPNPLIGGAERVALNVMTGLLDDDWTVFVYIISQGKTSEWKKLQEKYHNLILFSPDYKRELTGAWGLILFIMGIRTYYFDLVFSTHTHINGVLSLFRKAGILKSNSLVSRESTFIFERFYGVKRWFFFLVYKFFYGGQNLLICQTDGMKKSLISSLGFEPCKKIEVIKNPLLLSRIDVQNTSSLLMPNRPFIVCCGRLIKLKKFDMLVEAFSQSTLVGNYQLVIIGNGSELNNIKQLITRLGVYDDVTLLGEIDNPAIWFAHADIGVISSEIEGFPNVLIEMMASGVKNIISTPCTDGVLNIPYLSITNDHSVKSMVHALNNAANHQQNHSKLYRSYVEENHSLRGFIDTCISAGDE